MLQIKQRGVQVHLAIFTPLYLNVSLLALCNRVSVWRPSMRWSCSRTRQYVRPLWTVSTTVKSRRWTGPRADEIAEFSHTLIMIATPTVFHSISWWVIPHRHPIIHISTTFISDTFAGGGETLKGENYSKFLCENEFKLQIWSVAFIRLLLFFVCSAKQCSAHLLNTTKSSPTFLAERMTSVRHRRQDRRTM